MNTFIQERLIPEISKAMGTSDPSQLPRPETQILPTSIVMTGSYSG